MKKLLSLLICLMLLLSVIPMATLSASAKTYETTVKVGSTNYYGNVGDTFTYVASFAFADAKLSTGQIELPVDFTALEGETEEEFTALNFPIVKDAVAAFRFDAPSTTGLVGYAANFIDGNGCDFPSARVFFRVNFKILKAGTITMHAAVKDVVDVNGLQLVEPDGTINNTKFKFTESCNLVKKTTYACESPRISSFENVYTGVKFIWPAEDGAAKYRVFRQNGNSWSVLGDVAATSYTDTDVEPYQSYTYTVRCLDASNSYCSDYITAGFYTAFLPAPTISKFENVNTGVKMTIAPTTGVNKYRIYLKNGTSWKKLADTTALTYTHTGLTSGTKYTYTVRGLSDDGAATVTGFNPTGWTATFVAAPALTKIENTTTGVRLSWSKSNGAAKYRVYLKNGTSWSKLGDTTALNYTYTKAASNTDVTLTARCVSADGAKNTSGFDAAGKTIRFYAAPVISKFENVNNGVKMTWAAVAGVPKYRVFIKSGSSWKKLVDVTTTSLLHKGTKGGTKYTYTVRCLSADAKTYLSAVNTTGKTTTFIAPPTLKSVKNTSSGVRFTWAKSAGAVKYRVFRKTGSGGWAKLADVAGSKDYVIDKTSKNKTVYSYTVRAITSDGKAYASGYNTTGLKITCKR